MSEEKVYSWCNRCGALVVGDINHPCDKCGNHDLESFVVDIELVALQAHIDQLKRSLRFSENLIDKYEKTIEAIAKIKKPPPPRS